jgi:hypothetical protein
MSHAKQNTTFPQNLSCTSTRCGAGARVGSASAFVGGRAPREGCYRDSVSETLEEECGRKHTPRHNPLPLRRATAKVRHGCAVECPSPRPQRRGGEMSTARDPKRPQPFQNRGAPFGADDRKVRRIGIRIFAELLPHITRKTAVGRSEPHPRQPKRGIISSSRLPPPSPRTSSSR